MTVFKGKNILFFGPKTFGYELAIQKELVELGANVSYFNDKPFLNFFLIVLLRLKPKLIWPFATRKYKALLNESNQNEIDVVFVIKGEGISPKLLNFLKQAYPNAKFVLYLWDSISNVKNVEEKFSYFDSISSFDPSDCEINHQLKYRPLFFLDKYLNNNPKDGQGLFFIGTLNGDRSKVISKLYQKLSGKQKFEYFLFVRSNLELTIRKWFNYQLYNIDYSRLLRKPMSIEEINSKLDSTAAILDVEHPDQKGLTMRTFEVLASGKKLITTNKSILNHDFYNPSLICIIDRNNPNPPIDFFSNPKNVLSETFFSKYSLRGWLTEVLN